MIPLHDQKCRMSVVLRSINLLDGQFTQVIITCFKACRAHSFLKKKKKQDAFIKSIMQEDIPKTKPKTMLKRRVGYSEEAVSTIRAKLAAMAIDEEEIQDELLNTMLRILLCHQRTFSHIALCRLLILTSLSISSSLLYFFLSHHDSSMTHYSYKAITSKHVNT